MSIRTISQRTGISEPYLEQIFTSLRRDGLIDSVRGTQGGYRLARKPDQITVGDVLRSGEGSIAPVRCTESGPDACDAIDRCMTRPLWQDMADAVDAIVDRQTLADIVSAWNRQSQSPVLEYSI